MKPSREEIARLAEERDRAMERWRMAVEGEAEEEAPRECMHGFMHGWCPDPRCSYAMKADEYDAEMKRDPLHGEMWDRDKLLYPKVRMIRAQRGDEWGWEVKCLVRPREGENGEVVWAEEQHSAEHAPFGPTRRIHCACGISYDVTTDIPPEHVPGLCPQCGGERFRSTPLVEVYEEPIPNDDDDGVDDLDLPGSPDHDADIADSYHRARDDELARRAEHATKAEERALQDFTSAMEEVRCKLVAAVGGPANMKWMDLVPAVEKLATDLANTKANSANVFLAVNIVREHLWKIRDVAAKALGEDVPDWTTGDEHTATAYVERIIARLEENAEERSRMVGTINRLEEDVKVLHEGDETEAGTWKLHYVSLCQEIGIPRSVYGDVKAPKVDEIARYMGQTYTPLTKLAERVADIENRLPKQQVCGQCGARYPTGVQFCPSCGKEPS